MRQGGDLVGETQTVPVPGPSGPVQIQIVINRDGASRPVEVFIHGVRGRDRSMTNALGRIVSLALAGGIPADAVSRTLSGIGGEDPPVWWNGTQIRSIPDAVAKVLAPRGDG